MKLEDFNLFYLATLCELLDTKEKLEREAGLLKEGEKVSAYPTVMKSASFPIYADTDSVHEC